MLSIWLYVKVGDGGAGSQQLYSLRALQLRTPKVTAQNGLKSASLPATQGLLSADPASGEVSLLASRLPNASLTPAEADIVFCDGVEIARDGRIFFTDASRIPPLRGPRGEWDSLGASVLDALQASGLKVHAVEPVPLLHGMPQPPKHGVFPVLHPSS